MFENYLILNDPNLYFDLDILALPYICGVSGTRTHVLNTFLKELFTCLSDCEPETVNKGVRGSLLSSQRFSRIEKPYCGSFCS